MELIRTLDWPQAPLADNFRIIKKDGATFLLEFGSLNKANGEMTIVSQIAVEADTLEALSTSLYDIINTMENLEKLDVTK